MADLPHSWPGYIQVEETQYTAAVSEYTMQKVGQAINSLIDLKNISLLQSYASPGSYSWTVPANCFYVILEGCGGGGGGSGSYTILGQAYGMGGRASIGKTTILPVTPGNIISITIPSGGAGGPSALYTSEGSVGGDLIFDGIIISQGGLGGPVHGSYAPGSLSGGPGPNFYLGQRSGYSAGYGNGGNGPAAISGAGSAGAGGFLNIFGATV